MIFGVLTTDTVGQAVERIEQASGYADSAVEMVNRLKGIRERKKGDRVGVSLRQYKANPVNERMSNVS